MSGREGRLKDALLNLAESTAKALLTALLRGWMFMLAVQVAHEQWIPQLSGIGYWWAVLICLFFPIAASAGKDEA